MVVKGGLGGRAQTKSVVGGLGGRRRPKVSSWEHLKITIVSNMTEGDTGQGWSICKSKEFISFDRGEKKRKNKKRRASNWG